VSPSIRVTGIIEREESQAETVLGYGEGISEDVQYTFARSACGNCAYSDKEEQESDVALKRQKIVC